MGRNFLPKYSLPTIEEAAGLYHGTDNLHLRHLTCGIGNAERSGERKSCLFGLKTRINLLPTPTSMQFRKAIYKHAINRPYIRTSISNSTLAKIGQLKGTLPDPLSLPQTTLLLSNLLLLLSSNPSDNTCLDLSLPSKASADKPWRYNPQNNVHCTIKVCNFQPILLTQPFWQPLVRQQPCCRAQRLQPDWNVFWMQQVLAQTPYPNRPASRFSGSSTPRSHRASRATCRAACAARCRRWHHF